jgi:phosphopantothenoylcysteine synthetase/decarboxylase
VTQPERHLTIVCCGAAPTANVGVLVRLAHERFWNVRAVPTPDALSFIDAIALESMTANTVEAGYRSPHDARPPRPDALIVAPATFNTVNKAALGITDTHALGVIAETIGRGVPVVMVPWVNPPLAARVPFRRALNLLRDEGVQILLREENLESRPFGADDTDTEDFPWAAALAAVDRGGARPGSATAVS